MSLFRTIILATILTACLPTKADLPPNSNTPQKTGDWWYINFEEPKYFSMPELNCTTCKNKTLTYSQSTFIAHNEFEFDTKVLQCTSSPIPYKNTTAKPCEGLNGKRGAYSFHFNPSNKYSFTAIDLSFLMPKSSAIDIDNMQRGLGPRITLRLLNIGPKNSFKCSANIGSTFSGGQWTDGVLTGDVLFVEYRLPASTTASLGNLKISCNMPIYRSGMWPEVDNSESINYYDGVNTPLITSLMVGLLTDIKLKIDQINSDGVVGNNPPTSIRDQGNLNIPLGGIFTLKLYDGTNPINATYKLVAGTASLRPKIDKPDDIKVGLWLDRVALLFKEGNATSSQ